MYRLKEEEPSQSSAVSLRAALGGRAVMGEVPVLLGLVRPSTAHAAFHMAGDGGDLLPLWVWTLRRRGCSRSRLTPTAPGPGLLLLLPAEEISQHLLKGVDQLPGK